MRCSRYVIFSPYFAEPTTGQVRRIAFSCRSSEQYLLDASLAEAVAAARLAKIPGTLLEALRRDRLLVDDDEDELASVLSENAGLDLHDDEYQLTLMPSAYCQMGCTYCGQNHGQRDMSPDVQDATIEYVGTQIREHAFKRVNVTWFGGEPLAGLSTIRALTPRLLDLCDKAGSRYQAAVITNGLALSTHVARELVERLGVTRIQITLDGPQEVHDLRRYLKGGHGTYATIMRNVAALEQEMIPGLNLHVRVNVDAKNAGALQRLIADLRPLKTVLSRFYLESVFDWDNGADRDALSAPEFSRVELEFLRQLVAEGIPCDLIPTRTTGMCKVYYLDHAPVIDPAGRLYCCYEYPLVKNHERESANRVGDVFRGGSKQNSGHLSTLMAAMKQQGHDCLACEVFPVCGGICEPHWMKGMRRCPGFKFSLGERLILAYQVHKQETRAKE